jgi:hypothetical protein
VEGISQGPPTRTLLRLQSLGTDYGSDEFGTCTSSEENGQAKEEEIQIPTVEFLLYFLNYLTRFLKKKICIFHSLLEEADQTKACASGKCMWKNRYDM